MDDDNKQYTLSSAWLIRYSPESNYNKDLFWSFFFLS